MALRSDSVELMRWKHGCGCGWNQPGEPGEQPVGEGPVQRAKEAFMRRGDRDVMWSTVGRQSWQEEARLYFEGTADRWDC